MTQPPLEILSDRATEAHTRIQQNFDYINPIVGVNRGMRKIGFPADTMTIDCLRTKRRIILILHDDNPEQISYQFAMREEDPAEHFELVALETLTADMLYDWMVKYFSKEGN